ncbi:MAG: hypothetical protein II114_05640 [Treponema sp.]|nr:hypothetical protein [Treponema sp.]
MENIRRVFMKKADCSLDLGDGSERGFYVDQDYILRKLHKPHRGISLMYTYYPTDEGWPLRASIAFPQKTPGGAWDYPYEDYFPYRGGVEGLRDDEPFKFMKEIRAHGQDVVLTMTINPLLDDEYIIAVAKDLRPYGRVLLRINHECTGTWFCFGKRADYQKVADFFVRCCRIFHKHSPNVKLILCAGMWEEESGKIEMEDIFLEAFKEADYWSGDQYLALHWGWPADVALKGGTTFACHDVDAVYEKAKNTWKRLKTITGQEKPMLLSELNADGDVTGPYEQAAMMKHFMERLQKDEEKWLSGFTMYQFRDDGRLGLEITDPNNSGIGIEQPLLSVYRKELHKDFFSKKLISGEPVSLPCTLRWGNADDSDGIETTLHLEKNPHYAELYFDSPDLLDMNLMIEFGGYWFYKKPGVKCIDMMSRFFDNPVSSPEDIKLRIFAPPASGMNKSEGGNPYEDADGDWMNNQYTELKSFPRIRIEYEPVM